MKEIGDLADFVRKSRKKDGMTQVALSQFSGVGLRFIRELEAGKPTLRMDKVNQVLWLFGKELGVVESPKSEIELERESVASRESTIGKPDVNAHRPLFSV